MKTDLQHVGGDMTYTKKDWNAQFKEMKLLLKKETSFEEGKKLLLFLYDMVHSSNLSDLVDRSFEDDLWENISEHALRESVNKKKRTVLYGMWHTTRIEDITMNLLVADRDQVIDSGDWIEKMDAIIYSTGNELTPEQIQKFSATLNVVEFMKYRAAVTKRTRELLVNLTFDLLKRPINQEGLAKAKTVGAVANHEDALWLLEYWGNKTTEGIIYMPATRHNLVHINESLEAKEKSRG